MATVESLLGAAKQLGEVQQRKVAALVGAVVAEAAGKQRWLCDVDFPPLALRIALIMHG